LQRKSEQHQGGRQPVQIGMLLAECAEENIRCWALEETAVGKVARASLRARRDGDMEAEKRYTLPFLKAIVRIGMKANLRDDGNYRFTRKEIAEIEGLAQSLDARGLD
jgi:hypothetical protein